MQKYTINKDVYMGLMQTELGNTCVNLWNKNYLNAVGGWDETLTSLQEYNLMFGLLKDNDQIVYDLSSLTIIREREAGRISQSDPSKKWKNYLELRLKIIAYLQDYLPEYYTEKRRRNENHCLFSGFIA